MPVRIESIGEHLFWSYANLAMAHAAVSSGASAYSRPHFIVRSRLYNGLVKGRMRLGPFSDEDRLKLRFPHSCCYCGAKTGLVLDHLIPRKRGGSDAADNIVWACRACNSAKCAQDVLAWLSDRGRFPPLLLLRRYLKLCIEICEQRGILADPPSNTHDLPFRLETIPHWFPPPDHLVLWVQPEDG